MDSWVKNKSRQMVEAAAWKARAEAAEAENERLRGVLQEALDVLRGVDSDVGDDVCRLVKKIESWRWSEMAPGYSSWTSVKIKYDQWGRIVR